MVDQLGPWFHVSVLLMPEGGSGPDQWLLSYTENLVELLGLLLPKGYKLGVQAMMPPYETGTEYFSMLTLESLHSATTSQGKVVWIYRFESGFLYLEGDENALKLLGAADVRRIF